MSLPHPMQGSRMSQPTSREEQRDRLLEAALVHVPFDGWSRRALFAGAADLGLEPGAARRLFPRAGDDMLAHLERWADRQMLARVGPLDGVRVRDRIAKLVRTRLEVLDRHREAMRRAAAARMLPSNALVACASLWRTVDLMWVAAGDEVHDASYYSKRSLLAGVWTSTFLFWLDDRSERCAETWAFLERRIDNVMQLGRLRGRFDDVLHGLGRLNPLAARR
jgi:ubiquinone biosynthesis protein COQ9